MTGETYLGVSHRTFTQAVTDLLERDYAILGSHRVLALLAQDLHHLVESYFPPPERLAPGWIVWTGILATGAKANPSADRPQRELVTLAWPVCLPEDLQDLAREGEAKDVLDQLLKKRLRRMIEYGLQHPLGPVVLTVADLAILFGRNSHQISQLLKQLRQESGEPLPTMGYIFDQGMRPTHKVPIVSLYEAGLDEALIARQTGHSAHSVGHYLRDYERVKLMLGQGAQQDQIAHLIGMAPNQVQAYADLVRQFHPELFSSTESSPG
jgi:hypothetical protein